MTASTSELLLTWDQARPRTQQRELGWSDLGVCRRRAGYRIAGTEPSNPGSSIQAVLGTAIHDAIAQVLREIAPDGDLIEHEVTFAGILGHLDHYETQTATVRDTKSLRDARALERIRVDGPPKSHVWQVSGYGAGLIAQGQKVRRVGIDYIARDSGDEWRWEDDFDPTVVRAALAWIRNVRDTPLEMLSRDHDPDGPWCKNCPFFQTCWGRALLGRDIRTALFVDDPDAAKWAAKLDKARADKNEAERRETEAKGALDAIRPNDKGKSDPVDVGYAKGLQWSITNPQRLDKDAVLADYKEAGLTPPMKPGRTVTLQFVALPVQEQAA